MRLRGAKARGAGAEVAVGDIEQGQPPLHADGIGQHPQPPQLRRLPWLLVRALAPLAALAALAALATLAALADLAAAIHDVSERAPLPVARVGPRLRVPALLLLQQREQLRPQLLVHLVGADLGLGLKVSSQGQA